MNPQIKPLLNLSAIEAPPKFLQSLEDAAKFVKGLKEADTDIVNSAANCLGTEEEQRALQAGLLYLALTEPDSRQSVCTDIVLTARDNLNYVLTELTRLVAEAWPKMTQSVRVNLLVILAELISIRGASVELLMLHLYRRMPTGDISSSNLWLIESVLDLLIRNKEWLESPDRQQFLLPLTVYTFLRIIPDHYNVEKSTATKPETSSAQPAPLSTNVTNLRQRESVFIIELIRKNFDKCAQLGRDLIRMLHSVSRFEPFQRLWLDILNDLSTLSGLHKTVSSVLDIVTPQYFVQTLIPHEMEQWIRFMLRNVHLLAGFPVRRYQEFFHRKFFATPESQGLRVCLTRYIVNFFYPDNEMLASSLIPRWNIISWLISQSVCPIATYNIKMALFFDWMFFKPNDCIMNVEPAILAITHNLSFRSQPFALSLVDFLTKVSTTFHPPLAERIATSVRSGLEDMLRLGVIRSINPLLDVLLRASPDVYRNFNTLIGPLADSTILPPASNAPVNSANATSSSSLSLSQSQLDSSLAKSSSTTFIDVEKKQPHSPTTQSVIVTKKVKRESQNSSSKPPISVSVNMLPIDPRLRRVSSHLVKTPLSSVKTVNNGPASSLLTEEESRRAHKLVNNSVPIVAPLLSPSNQTLQKQPSVVMRPPSPLESSTFPTPPAPIIYPSDVPADQPINSADLLSPEDLKELMSTSVMSHGDSILPLANTNQAPKPKRLTTLKADSNPVGLDLADGQNSPSFFAAKNVAKVPSILTDFNSLSSPEFRCVNASDVIQQRIDDLRRKFQAFQFKYQYNVDTNVDIYSLISQLDDPIRCALENLTQAAKKAGIFQESLAASNGTNNSHSAPNVNPCESNESGLQEMCEAMENLVQSVLEDDCFDALEIASRTSAVVCQICLPLFESSIASSQSEKNSRFGLSPSYNRRQFALLDALPSQLPITEEQIFDSLTSPVFVLFRHLCEMSNSDPNRELLLLLLTEMQTRQPRIGYHLLYFLAVSKNADEKMNAYRNFCASQENPNLVFSLLRDMQLLADDNRFLFCYLLPTVYSVFSNDLTNNTDFIRLIVRKIDPSQANYLVCEILRGHLNFFHRSNITEILKASLEWSSMEQFFFWQLVNAHELPTRNFLPLISLVDSQKHPEACSHLLLLLQLEKPTSEVVRLLLSRAFSWGPNAADDLLSVTALHYWGCPGRQHAERFATILGNMINSAVTGLRAGNSTTSAESNTISGGDNSSSSTIREKKRNGIRGSSSSENLNQLVSILSHLDCMRKKCKNIAMLEATELQSNLQQVIHSSGIPAGLKNRFSELLTLVEDDSTDLPVRNPGSGASSRTTRQESAGDSNVVGSKGGHSLRNLDSRRAAEAERRYSLNVNSKKTRTAHPDLGQQFDSDGEAHESNGDSSNSGGDSDRVSATLSDEGTSSDDDDEEEELPLKRRKETLSRVSDHSNTSVAVGNLKRQHQSKVENNQNRRPASSVGKNNTNVDTKASAANDANSRRFNSNRESSNKIAASDSEEDEVDENELDSSDDEAETKNEQPHKSSRTLRRKKLTSQKCKISDLLDSDDNDISISAEEPPKSKRLHTEPAVSLVMLDLGLTAGDDYIVQDIKSSSSTQTLLRAAKSRRIANRRCVVDD